jgi:hypothetical protein
MVRQQRKQSSAHEGHRLRKGTEADRGLRLKGARRPGGESHSLLCFLILFLDVVVLGIELRASCMLGKYSSVLT